MKRFSRFSWLVGLLVALTLIVPSVASVPVPYVVKPTDGSSLAQVSASTSPFNARPGQLVKVNTATTAITVLLPSSPLSGATVVVGDDHSNASAHPITVSGNGSTVDGLSSYVINISSDVEGFVFFGGAANEWKRVALPTNVFDSVASTNYSVFRASDLENLVSNVGPTLPLSEANGGFGANVSSSTGVPVNASGAFSFVAPGTTGNVLTSNGSTWVSSAPSSGGVQKTDLLFSFTRAYVAQATNSSVGNFTLGNFFYAAPGATVKGVKVALKVLGGGSHSIKVSVCDPNGTRQATATATIPDNVATEIDFATPYVISTLINGQVGPWVVGAWETTGTTEVRGVGAFAGGVSVQQTNSSPIPWNANGITFAGSTVNSGGDSCPMTLFSITIPVDPVFQ